jgi:hypothetical protein
VLERRDEVLQLPPRLKARRRNPRIMTRGLVTQRAGYLRERLLSQGAQHRSAGSNHRQKARNHRGVFRRGINTSALCKYGRTESLNGQS